MSVGELGSLVGVLVADRGDVISSRETVNPTAWRWLMAVLSGCYFSLATSSLVATFFRDADFSTILIVVPIVFLVCLSLLQPYPSFSCMVPALRGPTDHL